MVECQTPEREVGGSIPTAAVLCPWARHFTPRKYWLITQEAVAPSRHDWKIVDWDVKPQHKQTKLFYSFLHKYPLPKKNCSWELSLSLGSWMTTCLGKSCSFGLSSVPFVNCCQFMSSINYRWSTWRCSPMKLQPNCRWAHEAATLWSCRWKREAAALQPDTPP